MRQEVDGGYFVRFDDGDAMTLSKAQLRKVLLPVEAEAAVEAAWHGVEAAAAEEEEAEAAEEAAEFDVEEEEEAEEEAEEAEEEDEAEEADDVWRRGAGAARYDVSRERIDVMSLAEAVAAGLAGSIDEVRAARRTL